jgi:HD superfamily phosphohydrolase YqeK
MAIVACELFKADHEMLVAYSTLLFDTTAHYPNIMTYEKQDQSSINQGAETHNSLLHGKTAKTLFHESQFNHKPTLT